MAVGLSLAEEQQLGQAIAQGVAERKSRRIGDRDTVEAERERGHLERASHVIHVEAAPEDRRHRAIAAVGRVQRDLGPLDQGELAPAGTELGQG